MTQKPSISSVLNVQLVSLSMIEKLAWDIIQSFPQHIQETLSLTIHIENYADEKLLRRFNLDNRYDLLGIYEGVPLAQRTVNSSKKTIFYLFRAPLLRYAQEFNEDLESVIRHVILTEFQQFLELSPIEKMNTLCPSTPVYS